MTDVLRDAEDRAAARHEAWLVALDRIELDVIRAERALTTAEGSVRVDEWTVPDDYGPIPTSLRPRAEDILARQQAVLRHLAERLGVTAQHQSLVDAIDRVTSHSPGRAVYVDVSA